MRVQDALNTLEPIDREVLSLRHFEQLTNTETARLLGVSEVAASNRYVRAPGAAPADPPERPRHPGPLSRPRRAGATVVLKAMAKEPSARYASAQALGDNLRRFLENRTILARRSISLERTSRWCRRNPVVAAMLTSVVALLTFIAGHYSVTATRYRHLFERADAAEIDGREKLFTSYVAQARASRFGRRPDQRFAALRALTEAAKIRRTPELRDEAIACMALPDLDEVHRASEAFRGIRLAFDPNLEHYAGLEWDGAVSVRRVADDREVRRLPSSGPLRDCFILAFSLDGRHLVVSYRLGSSRQLKVWARGSPGAATGGCWSSARTMRARSSSTATARIRRSGSSLTPMSATSRSAPIAIWRRPAATITGSVSPYGHSPTSGV